MLSVQQNYSRLFRPWDVSENKLETQAIRCEETNLEDAKTKKRKLDESKRENRLRKIRGFFKKSEANVHQDATVSTTTEDTDIDKKPGQDITGTIKETQSPVTSLSMCCDRILKDEKSLKIEKETKIVPPVDVYSPNTLQASVLPPPNMYTYVPDYLPTADIAHALGVPPTDPLLLESLAQGYAMELEYARILQQENEAKILNARKQRPKKYKCPHCHVGFSNNGQLKGHIRIHTGERPYKCEEKNCGKTFTRNEELTRHKRIHSGVRPFPCPTCGKKFGRRDHLKKHTRTHYLQAERMMPVFVPLSAVPHVGGFPYLYGY